jgi:hypothetical protein
MLYQYFKMSQNNIYFKNHISIYLILYKIDTNTDTNIYKVGKTNKSDFMNQYTNDCILLYQRIIENKGDTCNTILLNFKNTYKVRNDIGNYCFEGDFNSMIRLINSTIDNIFSKLPIMRSDFNIDRQLINNYPKNIPLISPKNILSRTPKPTIDELNKNRIQLGIKLVESSSKETIDSITKYLKCLTKERIINDYIKIGNCLNNIDNDLFDIWSNLIPHIENNNPFTISPRWDLNIKWDKMPKNKYNIADLKLWAILDNIDNCYDIIEKDIIRAINRIGNNITPYNMTMITHRHFKHYHIYSNDKWYFYDVESFKWIIDVDNLNITQSLIGHILIILEKYTNYSNIIKMYNDASFIKEILNNASKIFFNKNNFTKEYLMKNMIDYNNLP